MSFRFVALALLPLLIPASFTSNANNYNLPNMGDPSGSVISPEDEKKLGEGLMRWLRNKQLILDDPLVNDYINSIGYKLVAGSDTTQSFTFFAVNEQHINAFAAPGGFIGVNVGLILTTQSESELAAVLAHEIEHINQHHIARMYADSSKQKLVTAVAILAAILLGSQSSELTEAALAVGVATSAQMQINFTRTNEYEADRIGMQTLANAGFNPNSMPEFFERMQKALRVQGEQLPEFLSTHPVSISRIAESRNRARQIKGRISIEDINYHLIRARLKVMSATIPAEAENRFAQSLKEGSYRNKDAEEYGYALALIKNSSFKKAENVIYKLLRRDPDRIAYRIAKADLKSKTGNNDVAHKIYTDTLRLYPNNHALSIHYVEHLLNTNKPAQAHIFLQEYLRNRAPDSKIYKLFAQAAGKSGHLAEAYQYMAEHHFINGETGAAIDQLTRASALKNVDYYTGSRIEARLRQLEKIALDEKQ